MSGNEQASSAIDGSRSTRMKIRAAVARQPGAPLSIEELELRPPGESEILVKLVAVGICHTDISALEGKSPTPFPVVLGHEGAGIVEAVGRNVGKFAPGDHVIMSFDSCGGCPSCADHKPTYCHSFFPYNILGEGPDGSSPLSSGEETITGNYFGQSAFASHILSHGKNMVKVDRSLPLEKLGPLGCGIQTGAGAVINALKIQFGDSFAVFGTGSVGLSTILAARAVGASKIIAVDLQDSRLELASRLGATHTINSTRENPVEAIMAISEFGVDFTIDTTALPAVIRQAIESLSLTGTCGLLGVSPPGVELSFDLTHFMSGGRQLRGIVR
jgi:aryl-alcohol dehydrogenase